MGKKENNDGINFKKPLDIYYTEVDKLHYVDEAEEKELIRQIRAGEIGAAIATDKLIKVNLQYVIKVADKYWWSKEPKADLIGAGNFGLMLALEKFDETRGLRFIACAKYWVRQSIIYYLKNESRTVRLPLSRQQVISNVIQTVKEYERTLSYQPTCEQLAEYLGISVDELIGVMRDEKKPISLLKSALRSGDEDLLLQDTIKCDHSDVPDHFLMSQSLGEEIDKVLVTLKPREAEIIRLYFGFEDDRPLTLEEIGEIYKLTRERIRQIKEKALRKLKQRTRSEPLRKYLG